MRPVHDLPKAHLHLHFTGSMRHSTLLELAERDGIRLPPALTDEWPPQLVATDEKGWFRFQRLYDVARSVLRTEDDVRRLVREAAEDDAAEDDAAEDDGGEDEAAEDDGTTTEDETSEISADSSLAIADASGGDNNFSFAS